MNNSLNKQSLSSELGKETVEQKHRIKVIAIELQKTMQKVNELEGNVESWNQRIQNLENKVKKQVELLK